MKFFPSWTVMRDIIKSKWRQKMKNTPIGIYYYKIMSFGLKNVGATYQRAMIKIFHDLIHKIVEYYVDDLVIKAMSYEEHLQYLEVVFNRLREHALKLNSLKCAFMVSSGKFLRFNCIFYINY
jgi:Reverse transcriptase (RNA-dependent DNA polymerase)